MGTEQRKHIWKRMFSLLLICALAIGILPVGRIPVSKAANASASAKETFASVANAARSGYGLSNPSTTSDGVTIWDCVYFGNYWQSDTNEDGIAEQNDEKEPIKWRVLSVNGDDAFLLADKNLDVQRYNDTEESVTWETCTLRSWLNGYGADANKGGVNYSDNNFLDNAFTEAEQQAIKNTTVVNEDNPSYGTEGGENTVDKVYLLSISEAMNPSYGFTSTTNSTATREAVNTAYVAAGGRIKSGNMNRAGCRAIWWLRSPGIDSSHASIVDYDGYVYQDGSTVDNRYRAARPALHLNLNASSDAISTSNWSYAGTVTSDGGRSKKVTGLKLMAKKKAIQASWKKVSGVSGYELWYSTSKKFEKKKSITVKKAKFTIKNLKQKKVYFVKVRAYTVKNGKKVYGTWSKVRKKKVK